MTDYDREVLPLHAGMGSSLVGLVMKQQQDSWDLAEDFGALAPPDIVPDQQPLAPPPYFAIANYVLIMETA